MCLSVSGAIAEETSVKTIRLHYREGSGPQGGFLHRIELARPRVGLALSGGGARGFAHIGVLKALEAAGIPIDMVAGTSMGCVVGGLYAAGHSPEDLERISKEIDWPQMFADDPHRASLFLTQKRDEDRSILRLRFGGWKLNLPSALTSAQKLSDLLADLTMTASYRAQGDFDNLYVPFRAVVTDMVTGQSMAIREGDLGEALRAGLAVPLVFTPIERDSMMLADGGLLDIIPVEVTRELGADVVVAVDVTSPLSSREQLEKPWALAEQIITIMIREPKLESLAGADVIISPDLQNHQAYNYGHIDDLILAGERAAMAAVEEIQERIRGCEGNQGDTTAFWIRSVRVLREQGGVSGPPPALPLHPGDKVNEGQVREILRRLYEDGTYRDVYATLLMAEDGVQLTFHLEEMPLFFGYQISGNTLFSDQELLGETRLKPGQTLNLKVADGDVKSILDHYHLKGYALARFKDLQLDPEEGIISGELEEGAIQEVRYLGNEKTKRWVLSRELPLKKGDIFNIQDARRGIRNIYGAGLFERVTLEIQRGAMGAILFIRVKEKASVSLRLGARYDLEKSGEIYAVLGEDNFLGVGSKLSLYLQGGKRREKYQLSLEADRIFKTYLTFNFSGFVVNRDWDSYVDGVRIGQYDLSRRGGRFFFGQHIRRFGMVSVEGRAEHVKLNARWGHGFPVGKKEIRSIILRSLMDTLDRFPFPMTGRIHSAYLEIGEPVLGGTEEFRKTFFSLESYSTIWRRHTIFARGSVGVSEGPLPFSEQFLLGGEETLYGYYEEELRGNKLFLFNIGYRMQLVKKLYFSSRYDVGNVWENELQIKWKTTRHAIGVELALDTPLGPIKAAYGRASDARERVYFSAGFRF